MMSSPATWKLHGRRALSFHVSLRQKGRGWEKGWRREGRIWHSSLRDKGRQTALIDLERYNTSGAHTLFVNLRTAYLKISSVFLSPPGTQQNDKRREITVQTCTQILGRANVSLPINTHREWINARMQRATGYCQNKEHTNMKCRKRASSHREPEQLQCTLA